MQLKNCPQWADNENWILMKHILTVYQWCVAMPILLVMTIITALLTIFFSLLGMSRRGGYYPAHFWAKLWCILMFVKVEVKGRENIDPKTSYVFVANHQGAYDIYLVYGYLNHNFKWMMKKSLEKIPFVGAACRISKHIMVDRSSASAIQQTMDSAKRILKGGMSLVVFPEGSRTPDGEMKKFKRGAFSLATEFGLPIVPLTIDGSYDVMPKNTFRITPGKISLTIHKPIYFDKVGADNKALTEELLEKSYNVIKGGLPG